MEHYNLREIRRQLPLGGIAEIADRLDVSPTVVSNIFNNGRKGKYREPVIACAVELIESQKSDPDIMKRAKDLNLTTNSMYPVPVKKKKSKSKGADEEGDFVNVLLKIAGVGVVVFLGYTAWNKWQESITKTKINEFEQGL